MKTSCSMPVDDRRGPNGSQPDGYQDAQHVIVYRNADLVPNVAVFCLGAYGVRVDDQVGRLRRSPVTDPVPRVRQGLPAMTDILTSIGILALCVANIGQFLINRNTAKRLDRTEAALDARRDIEAVQAQVIMDHSRMLMAHHKAIEDAHNALRIILRTDVRAGDLRG